MNKLKPAPSKIDHLTDAQARRLELVEAKLPDGWEYNLRDESENGGTGRIWGCDLYDRDNLIGGVSRGPSGLTANTMCADDTRQAVRLALNRVAAALWHVQPAWQRDDTVIGR